MKKVIVIIAVIIALVVANLALASNWTLDLFEQVKYNTFQVGMSVKRAESLFSDYELTSRTETQTLLGKSIILTFDNGLLDESLVLMFTNDKLQSFTYTNWQVK
ncbi:hypothetical protein ES703_14034 [subsurface metagenome]